MYQKIILVGNLGSDPERRATPDGTPVTSFSVATNKRWTTKDGQQGEKTVWWRVTCWRALAETCAKYLTKGRQVLVEGELSEPRAWQGKDGEWRASLDLTAYTVKFVGGREDAPRDGASAPNAGAVEPIGVVGDEDVPF
jgi:single-strand DNA-binding protein